MSWLLLLSSYALAGGPVAVVLPTDGETPDDKELKKHLEEWLDRSNLSVEVGEEALERPKPFTTALLAHPGECWVDVNDNQRGELKGLLEKADELFLVLPTSKLPKGARVWRWSGKNKRLEQVAGKARALAPAEKPAKMVWLTVQGKRVDAAPVDAAKAFFGVEAYEVVETDGTLVDQLLGYPEECEPELEDAAKTRMGELADGVEGDLVVAVATEKEAIVWRWDGKHQALRRVTTTDD